MKNIGLGEGLTGLALRFVTIVLPGKISHHRFEEKTSGTGLLAFSMFSFSGNCRLGWDFHEVVAARQDCGPPPSKAIQGPIQILSRPGLFDCHRFAPWASPGPNLHIFTLIRNNYGPSSRRAQSF